MLFVLEIELFAFIINNGKFGNAQNLFYSQPNSSQVGVQVAGYPEPDGVLRPNIFSNLAEGTEHMRKRFG